MLTATFPKVNQVLNVLAIEFSVPTLLLRMENSIAKLLNSEKIRSYDGDVGIRPKAVVTYPYSEFHDFFFFFSFFPQLKICQWKQRWNSKNMALSAARLEECSPGYGY